MIYVNGDSHSAGAEIVKTYCFAQDDPRYLAWGKRPHPEAILETYGYKLASAMNQPFHTDAESASSNHRILRTTKHFIENTKNTRDLFVVIGWATWEREEWQDGKDFIQVTASGTDSVPEHMAEDYKQWVFQQTEQELDRKTQYWHDTIWDLHCSLDALCIKHLFFNTYLQLESNVTKDWGDSYINPYDQNSTFYYWLKQNGHQTVNANSYHYGAQAHTAWFQYILPYVKQQYTIKTGLTNTSKRSIVTKAKQQFKGFN